MSRYLPYLAEEAIERDAAALLAEYEHARGVMIEPPIPIEDIVEKHLKLGIEFDDTHRLFGIPGTGLDLGQGPDILGAIFFDEKRVVVDEGLDPEENPNKEGRYRFTLAHEGGGHWRLRRPLYARDPAQTSLVGGSSVPSVICRSSRAKERVEWQADFYASCLLMPRNLVFREWKREFGDLEVGQARFRQARSSCGERWHNACNWPTCSRTKPLAPRGLRSKYGRTYATANVAA